MGRHHERDRVTLAFAEANAQFLANWKAYATCHDYASQLRSDLFVFQDFAMGFRTTEQNICHQNEFIKCTFYDLWQNPSLQKRYKRFALQHKGQYI